MGEEGVVAVFAGWGMTPITKEYREGYEGIRWDVDSLGVVRAVPDRGKGVDGVLRVVNGGRVPVEGSGLIPGMPESRYQGC